MYTLNKQDISLIDDLIYVYGSKAEMYGKLFKRTQEGLFQDDYFFFIYDTILKLDDFYIARAYNDLSLNEYKKKALINYFKQSLVNTSPFSNLTTNRLIAYSIINRLKSELLLIGCKNKEEVSASLELPKRRIAIQLYKKGIIKDFYNFIFMNDSIQHILSFKGIEYLDTILLPDNIDENAISQDLEIFINDLIALNCENLSVQEKEMILTYIVEYLKCFSFQSDEMISYLLSLDLDGLSSNEFISKVGVSCEYIKVKIK